LICVANGPHGKFFIQFIQLHSSFEDV